MLAAARAPDAKHANRQKETADWPHSEAPLFHLALSSVALAAALVLVAASVIRSHRPLELAVQVALLALIVARLAGIVAHHHARGSAPEGTTLVTRDPARTGRRRPPG